MGIKNNFLYNAERHLSSSLLKQGFEFTKVVDLSQKRW